MNLFNQDINNSERFFEKFNLKEIEIYMRSICQK